VADGKLQANRLNGFGVSADLMFELSRAVDPSTATPQNLKLYKLSDPPGEIPIDSVRVMSPDSEDGEAPCQQTPPDPGCVQVLLRLSDDNLPLDGKATYAVVVHDGLRGLDGKPVVPMLIGHFMKSDQPLAVDGVSQLESVDDADAARLEGVRVKLAQFLDHLGRNDVVTAWPVTTMDALPALRDAIAVAGKIGGPADPENVTIRQVNDSNRADSFGTLFPGNLSAAVRLAYESRLDGVGRIVEGTIKSPYFLDRQTRRWHRDGSYEFDDVRFVMTVPENPPHPTPVVIFGHAIVTDRRFVLTIAGALAQKGFAAVAIDFPFHGERIACVEAGSLIAFPNFLPQQLQDLLGTGWDQPMLKMYPCKSGADATCSPDGQCLDKNGNPEPFSNIIDLGSGEVVMDMKPASGAAFLDINDIPYINDHFAQAMVDLGALKRSLREGYWSVAAGTTFKTDAFYYAGQSLGGIIGATYVAMDPDITRGVLNVPGCDLVDMFQESVYFGPQVDDYFNRNHIPLTSYEHERNMNVVRWLIDSVDPQTVAHLYRTNNRPALIQMDSGQLPGISNGDFVIPNRTTRILQRISGLPMREYPSAMHGDLVIPVLGDQMLTDLAAYMAKEIDQ
jgi:pimeloyl-ACP methyl ester carboxylesterase